MRLADAAFQVDDGDDLRAGEGSGCHGGSIAPPIPGRPADDGHRPYGAQSRSRLTEIIFVSQPGAKCRGCGMQEGCGQSSHPCEHADVIAITSLVGPDWCGRSRRISWICQRFSIGSWNRRRRRS
jgi:hypothetical protein